MNKQKRAIALLLAAAVLLVTAFSLTVLVVEANHDCAGEDCAVCRLMDLCENNLRLLSAAMVLLALFVTALAAIRQRCALSVAHNSMRGPVQLKVKLLN